MRHPTTRRSVLAALEALAARPRRSPARSAAPGPAAICPQMATVQFDAGPGAVFYDTELDTDGTFSIAGRSTRIDEMLAARGAAPRPPVPSCG